MTLATYIKLSFQGFLFAITLLKSHILSRYNKLSFDIYKGGKQTQNVKNAADIAIASKNPYAMAAGKAVKTADKLTGGKSSEALGKGLSKATNKMPAGKTMQDMLNKANESGLGDKLGQTARAANNDFSTNNQ